MKIKALKNIRNFKQDQIIDLLGTDEIIKDIFDLLPVILLVGENGSGKSTLLQAIKGKFLTSTRHDISLYNSDIIKLAENFAIEGFEVDKIFSYDSVLDDGLNMNNAYDASAYIASGGFHTRHLSHGQKTGYYINKLFDELEKYRKGNPDSKIGIILDEFDKGFSLKLQKKAKYIVYNLIRKFNPTFILISTHNYFLINDTVLVYDMETSSTLIGDQYIKELNATK